MATDRGCPWSEVTVDEIYGVCVARTQDRMVQYRENRLAVRRRCLENVEDGKSVAPSLRLMQRIIDAQPEISINAWTNAVVGGGTRSAGGVGRKDEILETLDKDRSLLKLLVDVSLRLTVDVVLFVK